MSPLTILLLGGGVVMLLLVVGLVVSVTSRRSIVEERLGRYLEEDKKEDIDKTAGRAALAEWVNKRVEKSNFGEKLAKELAQADLKFKTSEYIALFGVAILGGAFITFLIGGRSSISALIGAVVGALLPRMYVKSQQSRRLIRFNDQLPDMLNMMVNGLRAGFSTMQAMEAVSKEMPVPICDEFRRVVQEMQLGIPMERALANLLRRIPSEDLDFVVTAINVQREVGGNMAEILEIISFTIRERIRIKGDIRVLTAQVMYSGRILSLMPVGLICILWFLNKEYIMEFFSPQNILCGSGALGLAATLITVGYFIMTRISKIEV